jgi:hypothetical protein
MKMGIENDNNKKGAAINPPKGFKRMKRLWLK